MSIESLKTVLRSRHLKTSGKKAELVDRLQNDDRENIRVKEHENNIPSTKELAKDSQSSSDKQNANITPYEMGRIGGMIRGGADDKQEAGIEESTKPKYDGWELPQLKEECKSRRLMISGSRPTLVHRLEVADHESSLPFKQAMEAEARKRRHTGERKETDSQEFKRTWKKYDEVVSRGPAAKPLYDDYGYALSYEKLANRPRGFRKSAAHFKREDEYFARMAREDKMKMEIMGVAPELFRGTSREMDAVVARDLEIPLHKVEVCDFQEWKKHGFKLNENDMKRETMSQEIVKLLDSKEGSAYRV
jgi:hypothetical protein